MRANLPVLSAVTGAGLLILAGTAGVSAWAGPAVAGTATLLRTGAVAGILPGTVRTIAGGIGGPARATSVGLRPCGLSMGAGLLYVSEGTTIRRLNPVSDWLSNVAGVGVKGFAADGTPALSAELGGAAGAGVCGVAVDRWGTLLCS